ncbi:cation transport protein ChaC [Rhodobium orientis]|uniref:glutathione-specific gamma-glutamylcyclotransferase n=1 Tax=Rhodobium orientis TaxID=34017 RepID=A0A327JEV2_9HYPH|nr:gamma-glutamylcyclotransferase [Rhodobium orientis]MBB4303577.1 cation transport protein ChaC [Rhodobium orientis]MBK5951966.1 gamma-glutamylcyclotransferase [Rhodobium orientis]RAI24859.1 gamma-glutamylcyclotransferase [Rhodobium orientis]
MQDFWVFGYGSLMWRPGFDHVEAAPARIAGVHRALCVYSYVHRGTPERPGLVLGLDRGGSCVGMAFRVAAEKRDETLAYLRAREQVTMVYKESIRRVVLEDGSGRAAQAIAYVVDRDHEQYAGVLPEGQVIDIVRHGKGQSGPNVEYVVNTARHLEELSIRDHRLTAIADALSG